MSQGSSSVIAALSFITGIIRCTFNKPWSQIGILSYAPINNGWIREHCLWLFRSQMSNKCLETINVCEVKYQQWQITQGQKFKVVPPGAKLLQLRQQRQQSCRVSTDPITIWIMGFSFLFWQGLSISHTVAARVHPLMHRLLQILNYWVPRAAHLSRQTNSFISSHAARFCTAGLSEKKKEGRLTIDLCKAFSPRTRPGDVFCGRKGKQRQ